VIVQVKQHAKYLFRKVHEEDPTKVYAMFPDILGSLINNHDVHTEQKNNILGELLPYITKDKQNKSLLENILMRLPEVSSVEKAHFCLHVLDMLRLGADMAPCVLKTIAGVLPRLDHLLADSTFSERFMVCPSR
jgi:hypothetical protein